MSRLLRRGVAFVTGAEWCDSLLLWWHEQERLMKISARNQIKGTIVSVSPGAVTATVKVDIGGGNIITSSITNEAVDDLALAVGDSVAVLVKSSDVMIGK